MNTSRLFSCALIAVCFCLPARATEEVTQNSSGLHIATNAADRVGLYGVTPVKQPSGSAQAALTDSTTGTAGTTLAAGVGITTLTFPVDLPSVGNADIVSAYVPGYKFKILKTTLVVNKPVTTGSKAATITPKISGSAVTGGVITANSTNCTPMGALVAGTTVTAANIGSASASITLTASSVTAFVEGTASVQIVIQNMDTADAVASMANLLGALRSANVGLGVMKGQ